MAIFGAGRTSITTTALPGRSVIKVGPGIDGINGKIDNARQESGPAVSCRAEKDECLGKVLWWGVCGGSPLWEESQDPSCGRAEGARVRQSGKMAG